MPLPASLTVAELKQLLDKQLNADDGILGLYLESAFEQAQAPPPYGCGRRLLPTPALVGTPPADTALPVDERIICDGRRYVRIPDAREITRVVIDGVELPRDRYEVLERDDHIVRLDLKRRSRVAVITGRFGFLTLPANLREAIYILAARAFYERAAQYADQVAIAEGAAIQSYYRQLPPRTKLVFATFTVASDIWGLA